MLEKFKYRKVCENMDFRESKTKDNLMRAFAGESQARNRYTFAAGQAKKEKLQVVEQVFLFTANQEKEHAEIFYKHLEELAGKNIHIDGSYPVDLYPDVAQLLRAAQHNEYEEHNDVYKAFAEQAAKEGFPKVAASFQMIAEIEKTHGDRFGYFAEQLEKNRLFISDIKVRWMCLNCGYIYEGESVPPICPTCKHDKGYFIQLDLAPFEPISKK